MKGDRDSVHRGRFPAIKDICTVLCVWRAWSIGKDRCYLPHDLSITTWKKRLRAFQAKTSRLSNSFLPAGCHTAQQLLLKLSELIILQSPPPHAHTLPRTLFLNSHFTALFRFVPGTALLFINTVFAFITFCIPVCFGGKFMVHYHCFCVILWFQKNRSDTVLTPVNNSHRVGCFFCHF